jgi:hypothetical protein
VPSRKKQSPSPARLSFAKNQPSCATCAHISRDGELGFCRRYPPSLKIDGGSQYVPVKLDWKCGEWRKA